MNNEKLQSCFCDGFNFFAASWKLTIEVKKNSVLDFLLTELVRRINFFFFDFFSGDEKNARKNQRGGN